MEKRFMILFTSIFLILNLFSLIHAIGEKNESITKEIVLQAINESEKVILEMQGKNFSIDYINDSLTEAKRVLEQVKYAEILRGEINSTEKEKKDARTILRLVNWKNITYGDVLIYTEEIQNRKEHAFLLIDKLAVEENQLSQSSNETKSIFEKAKIAFFEERYNDTEKLLLDFQKAVEKEKQESSTLAGIKNSAKNFFQKYGDYILTTFIFLIIVSYLIYKKFEKKILKSKIKKMKTEEQVLASLMKKTQEERFKENNISGLVYNIRMKKYEEKLQEIKEELPALEEKLRRFKNK